MFVWVIVTYYWVLMYEWCLAYLCMKIHMHHDELEVVFQIGERRYVANFATGRSRKNSLFVSFRVCVHICGGDFNQGTKHHH